MAHYSMTCLVGESNKWVEVIRIYGVNRERGVYTIQTIN